MKVAASEVKATAEVTAMSKSFKPILGVTSFLTLKATVALKLLAAGVYTRHKRKFYELNKAPPYLEF